jgi:hypothetical protein
MVDGLGGLGVRVLGDDYRFSLAIRECIAGLLSAHTVTRLGGKEREVVIGIDSIITCPILGIDDVGRILDSDGSKGDGSEENEKRPEGEHLDGVQLRSLVQWHSLWHDVQPVIGADGGSV